MASFSEALKVGRVKDADTFESTDGGSHRILGIDAPETGTPAGDAATAFSRALFEGAKEGTVTPTGKKGYYGRELSNASVDGADVAEVTVRAGHARPVAGDSFSEALGLAETGAITAEFLGLQEPRVDNKYVLDVGGHKAQDFRTRGGTFGRSVDRGVDKFQELMYSAGNVGAMALGDMFGTEVMDEWGMEGLERNATEAALNPAEIAEWDDVDGLADTYTYIVEALGEQAINIVSLLGTGGVGAGVKAGLGQVAKAGIAKKFSQLALKQGNKLKPSQLGAQAQELAQVGKAGISGQTAGVAAGSYAMGVGEIGNELREGGIDSPLTALIGGVPFAALDTIGFQNTIGRLFKGIDKGIATQSVKDIAQNVFRAAGLGAAAESSTEMLQEVISLSARAYHDPSFEIFSDENLHRIREAGIKAGIVGAVGGGGATAANQTFQKAFPGASEEDQLKAALAALQADPNAPPTGGGVATVEGASNIGPEGPVGPPPPGTPTPENAASQPINRNARQAEQPPVAEEFAPSAFPQRDSEYGYIPDEATVPAESIYEGAPPSAMVSIRGMLEEEIEPQMKQAETSINAYEALRKCLAS